MGVRIQELPETTGINKEDVLIVEDGQGTKKGTVQQLDETLGVSQLKEDLEVTNYEKIILDKTSFESGYYNVSGDFLYSDSLINSWMGHRKYLSVGNSKAVIMRHSYSETVQFNLYRFGKDKTKLSLVQIDADPNKNVKYDVGIGDYFYAVSITKGNVNDFTPENVNPIVSLIEYDCTADNDVSYSEEFLMTEFTTYSTVGDKNTDDYNEIGNAYNGMGRNGVILLQPKIIDVSENGFNVGSLYMVGKGYGITALKNNKAQYPYGACTIKGECYVKDVGFISDNDKKSANGGYAIHIDNNATQGKTLIFENCLFKSHFQSAFGVGLRKDMHLIFRNCVFENDWEIDNQYVPKKPHDYLTSGALFFHGSIDTENLGTQYITCIDCIFKSKGAGALRIEDVTGNLVIATFIGCNFYSNYYGSMNAIDIIGGAEKGYLCGSSVKLGKMSHGNNVMQLNAY